MHLPTHECSHYVGIDPGFTGSIGMMNLAGTSLRVWDMPVTKGKDDSSRQFDLGGLRELFKRIRKFPSVAVALEWPTTRPGEGAERSKRFGVGMGLLEAFCYLSDLDTFKLPPASWKQRLGLPGKTDPESGPVCLAFYERFYASWRGLLLGPKRGLRDGRMDALLLAHFLRDSRPITDTVRRFGKDSPEAAASILGWGGTRKKHRLRIR